MEAMEAEEEAKAARVRNAQADIAARIAEAQARAAAMRNKTPS